MYKIGLAFARISNIAEESLQHEHLGLAYLAGCLKRYKYNYKIFDANIENYNTEELASKIVEFSPDLLGFSVLYPNFEETLQVIKLIHSMLPKTIIILGGQHVTFCPREILENQEEIFGIIRGEGEFILPELIEELIKPTPNFEKVKGLSYQISGKYYENGDRPPEEDLELYGIPAHNSLEVALKKGRYCSLNLLAGRGCYYNCSFCNGNKFFDPLGTKGWRVRKPENVINELQKMLKVYGDKEFLYDIVNFCDLNFINNSSEGKNWIRQFINEIKQRNVQFFFYILTRVDSIIENKDLVSELRDIGLVQIEIGLESGSESGLNIYNKHINTTQSIQAVDFLRKLKVDIGASGFIMFNPYTKIQELRDNADFLKKISYWKYEHLTTRAALFPKTALTQQCKQDKLLFDNYSHYHVFNYRFLDPKVELLYSNLQTVDQRNLLPISKDISYIILQLIMNYRKLERLNIIPPEDLSDMLSTFERDIREIIELEYEHIYMFFIKILDMAEDKWNQKEFDVLKYKFTRNYYEHGLQLPEQFYNYTLKLGKLLETYR